MKTENPQVNFPEREKEVLAFWRKHKTFEASLALRKGAQPYMFYDGPPFASGTPHYGHLLAGTIKDIIPRYQTMKGRYVERRFGWDTHGLPIEMLTEQELGISGRKEILEFGIDKFNEACRSGVMRYVDEWRETIGRSGRWVDFDNDYKTMDLSFMESVWWVFKQLWDKGRIYEGARVVPFSWRLSTPLSNFEASSNYKTVQDPAVTVRLKLKSDPNRSILVWTTTPWTLPSNLAACVGADLDYVEVETEKFGQKERLILAEARLEAYFAKPDEYKLIGQFKGSELAGLSYIPLFDFYQSLESDGAFKVVLDDYVSTEDGTGVVHQSPAHGEDDYRIGQANNLPLVDPVDNQGNFTDEAPLFAGKNIKEADKDIIQNLKERGLLVKHDTLSHSYPFCDRSDTPLIYKAISAWYVRVEDMRERMLAHNNTIHWVPEHIKEGRFGNWLANARDWNISRNRYWGNPLPIWRCDKTGELECLGSSKELEEKTGQKVPDLHKHFVDQLTWPSPFAEGGTMRRVPEVLDCWFESGSMPYAQLNYPFKNKELFEQSFPADFIGEGLDQTRGWFYTLLVLSTALFDKAPFKNVIVNGMILAADGKKMSKRLKNYPDPTYMMDEYGADALRLYMISSAVVRGESLKLSEAGVKDIVRTILIPYWNVYSFFTTYANIDGYKRGAPTERKNILDRWILSRLQTLLSGIEVQMGEYRLYAVIPLLLEFLDDLTNWYLRRSRRRFWSEDKVDKQAGYDTMYEVLMGFSKALAPFLPFITEEIYRNLATLQSDQPESVHLCDYPEADTALRDLELEEAMALIQLAVGLGRTLRARENLRTRQPLQSITVVTRDSRAADILSTYGDHIRDELNVKEVLFSADEEALVNISLKPNFPKLGPVFGKEMKECAAELARVSTEQIEAFEKGQPLTILGRELTLDQIEVRREARSGIPIETASGVTVFFETELSDELINEGLAREFVNRVQRMRKEAGFDIADRIEIQSKQGQKISKALSAFNDYVQGETLALKLSLVEDKPEGELYQQLDIEGEKVEIAVRRATL